jgi:hypothetical protein
VSVEVQRFGLIRVELGNRRQVIEVDGFIGKRRRVGERVVLHHPLGLLNTPLRGKQACSPRAPTKIADKKSPLIERAFYVQYCNEAARIT